MWKIAESYYYQLPSTFDRDLSSATMAIKYYKEVIDLFPQWEFSNKSKERISEINQKLMDKDLYIADFYFKTGVFVSARYRYLDIIKKYEDSSIRAHAIGRVLESSLALKEFAQCLKFAEEYGQLKEKCHE